MKNLSTANGDAASGAAPGRTSGRLTARETQVLGLLLKGFNNQQIADQLGVKFYTVTSHLKNIYKKFDVHNRAGLVAKVLTGGLLQRHAPLITDHFPSSGHDRGHGTLPSGWPPVIQPPEPFAFPGKTAKLQ